MAVAAPQTGEPSLPLSSRLDQLTKQLAAEQARTQRANAITIAVGLLALVALSVYFYFGYTQVAAVVEPKTLVDIAEDMLDKNLPLAREALEKEVVRSSPAWAEKASQEARAGLPLVRKRLEGYVFDQTGVLVHETSLMTEAQFRNFLQNHREMLEQGFHEVAKDPQLGEDSLAEIEVALDTLLQDDLKTNAATLLETLALLNKKVARLGEGRGLAPEEQAERRVIMLARRLQMQTTNPDAPLAAPVRREVEAGKDVTRATPVSRTQ